jgi:electron transfer flavoprotein beta subunit
MGIKRAKSKECRILPAADLAAASAPVVTLATVTLPQKQKSTQFLTGSPAEVAATLVEKLRTEARVL